MKQGTPAHGKDNKDYIHTAEFLAWKRLQVSKAKLSTITEIATLLAGFAVVATVELQVNSDANPYLLTAFGVTTALLCTSSMMAVMISTCILPYIQTVVKVGKDPKESPHEEMSWFIDASWVLANTCSIFLFTLDLILLCWIKFTFFSVTASICVTAIMIPVLLSIVGFGILFYRTLIQHQYLILSDKLSGLDEMKANIEHHLSQFSIRSSSVSVHHV